MAGRVVIVPLGDAATPVVERLAGQGATVVFVAGEEDADDAGRRAAAVEASGAGRPAVYVLEDGDLAGFEAFVSELFSA